MNGELVAVEAPIARRIALLRERLSELRQVLAHEAAAVERLDDELNQFGERHAGQFSTLLTQLVTVEHDLQRYRAKLAALDVSDAAWCAFDAPVAEHHEAASPFPDEAEFRRRYRRLVRRLHPDLTQDPEQRTEREGLMRRLNQALEQRDLSLLLLLDGELGADDEATQPADERTVVSLNAEIGRLQDAITLQRQRRRALETSGLGRLLRASRDDAASLAGIAESLRADLARRTLERDALAARYRDRLQARLGETGPA